MSSNNDHPQQPSGGEQNTLQQSAIRQQVAVDASTRVIAPANKRVQHIIVQGSRFLRRYVSLFGKRLQRGYALVVTSLAVLRRDGINGFIAQAYRWLIRGERGYRRYMATSDEPGQVAFALSVREKIIACIQPYRDELHTSLSILNWDTPIHVEALFPKQAVFSPPQRWSELLYLGKTVDVVVTLDEAERLVEARRVARRAVIAVSASGEVRHEHLEGAALSQVPVADSHAAFDRVLYGSQPQREKRVLLAAPLLPEFDRESGSRRFFHLIQMLQELGWTTHVLVQQAAGGERYIELLRQRGVSVFWSDAINADSSTLLRANQYDMVVAIFWETAERLHDVVRDCLPNAKLVVDMVDLHFLRKLRQALASDKHSLGAAEGEEFRRELNMYYKVDGVLSVSLKEMQLVNDLLLTQRAYHLPDTEDLAMSDVPFSQRRSILFLGNFRHTPNVQALEFMLREVVPLIDPEVLQRHPLYVVGNDLPHLLNNYSKTTLPNVHFIGWVPSVTPYFERAIVSVVPLLSGAGTKRKVLQSLMLGTPTVSTTIGVEGMGLVDEQHVLVADIPKRFAEAINRLTYDADFWHHLQRSGREHAEAEFSYTNAKAKLQQFLAIMQH